MPKIDHELVQRKVEARKLAVACIELLNETLRGSDTIGRKVFWDELGQWVDQNRPLVPEKKNPSEPTPMTDAEARTFGQTNMWFGKYKGDRVCDIPLTYLDFMVGKDKRFMDGNAKRYLQNEKIAEELRRTLEE